MSIAFACPSCQKKYQVKESLAGKSAKCVCGTKIAIPAARTAAGASAPKRQAASATRRPAAAVAKAAPPAPASDDLGSFFESELSAEPAGKPVVSDCPSCGARMSSGGVMCVACGFDTRSGQKMAAAQLGGDSAGASRGKKKSLVRSAAGASATLTMGTVFSAIGALIGAAVWAGVAKAMNVEIGYIAWGLGGLAGLGMAIGHRDGGAPAGLIAAGMSLLGIVAAKVLIVKFVLGMFILDLNFLSRMFDPIDAIFALFAVVTAFKLGAQGGE